MKNYAECIGSFYLFDHAEGAALGRFVRRVEDEVERGFDVGGGEWPAVVKFDVGLEMEGVSERVGGLPGLGKVAVEIHLGVAPEKAGKDECVEALGLAVAGEAGVQVGGVGFDEEGERGGVKRSGAVARRREAKQQRREENKDSARRRESQRHATLLRADAHPSDPDKRR